MELLYLLAGGVLVLAGLFIGSGMQRTHLQEKQKEPIAQEGVEVLEDELKKAQAMRDQWNNLLKYDGRDQKAGG